MKIGLIDVDGHNFPNFALMKISAWHKALGDMVEWATIFEEYDIIYASKVFTFTPDFNALAYRAKEIIRGGLVTILNLNCHKRLRTPLKWTTRSTHNTLLAFNSFQGDV